MSPSEGEGLRIVRAKKLLAASLFQVVRPVAPSSVLAPSSDARSPGSCLFRNQATEAYIVPILMATMVGMDASLNGTIGRSSRVLSTVPYERSLKQSLCRSGVLMAASIFFWGAVQITLTHIFFGSGKLPVWSSETGHPRAMECGTPPVLLFGFDGHLKKRGHVIHVTMDFFRECTTAHLNGPSGANLRWAERSGGGSLATASMGRIVQHAF